MNAGQFQEWSGESWQKYVNELLSVYHSLNGERYQRIFDKVQGDGGLEGFSNTGIAYQAYADEDSVSTKDRAAKQKGKITTDLEKLATYEDFWESVLQGLKFTNWCLMVPTCEDKSVLAHARKKAAELKKRNLRILSKTFDARICTDADFPEARNRLTKSPSFALPLSLPDHTDGDIETFSSNNPDFLGKLEAKLATVIPEGGEEAKATVKEFVRFYLQGSKILASLEVSAPAVWEQIDSLKSQQTHTINATSAFSTAAPDQRLQDVQRDFEKRLESSVNLLRPETISALSWGVVAEWLGFCPLRFKGTTKR